MLDRSCCLLLHLGSPFLEVKNSILVDVSFVNDVLNVGDLLALDVQSLHHLEGALHITNTSISIDIFSPTRCLHCFDSDTVGWASGRAPDL